MKTVWTELVEGEELGTCVLRKFESEELVKDVKGVLRELEHWLEVRK